MTSFQDARDEAIEADEAKEVRSTQTNPKIKMPSYAHYFLCVLSRA